MKTVLFVLFIALLICLFILLGCVLYDIINKIIAEIKDVNSGSYNWEVRDRNRNKNKHKKL